MFRQLMCWLRRPAFFRAIEHDDLEEAVRLLKLSPALIRATTVRGNTALHIAAAGGQTELAAVLLRMGADVGARNKSGWTPLHAAALHGHTDAIELLIASGAEVDAREQGDNTPLMFAATRHKAAVQALIAHGANVNAKNKTGNTPLGMVASLLQEGGPLLTPTRKLSLTTVAEVLFRSGATRD